jgi:hypothetical protein
MATHTIYRRAGPSGDFTLQVAGLSLKSPGPKAGRAKFAVPAEYAPRPGDEVRDDAGQWWTVEKVGEAADDGTHPVTCTPAKGK